MDFYKISSTFLDKKLTEFNLNDLYYSYNKQNSHNIKEVLSLVSTSNIDFTKRGWTVELSKIINKTPSYSNKIIKEKFPQIWEMCYKHNK